MPGQGIRARRRPGRATIAAGIAAGWLASAGCASAGKLSAAEIVEKNVAARGGLDAWRKVETMVWVGRIESAHAPMASMPFELAQKRPNKTRLQIDAMGQKSVRVFDGARGWKLRPAGGRGPEVQPFAPQEVRFAQGGHGIDGPLMDHAARGNSVTLEGVEEIGKRKAYHLAVHLAKGGSEDVWVDSETYLEVRYERPTDGPAGAPRSVSANYGDYRTVEGLRIPFLIETGGGPGATPDRMQIERVILNAPLSDSAFEGRAGPRGPRDRMPPGFAPRPPGPHAPRTAPTAVNEKRGPVPR